MNSSDEEGIELIPMIQRKEKEPALAGDLDMDLPDDGGAEEAPGGERVIDHLAVDSMKVMQEAIRQYSEDKYFESGEVTALVRLRDGESADEAVIIELTNVHKTYLMGVEGVPALRGVSLGVRRGEFVIVYGNSGGGKSTLLNIIGTIDLPTKGAVKVCGKRITKSTTDPELAELRRNQVGFVFQTFNLISSLTALENVELPMILAGRLSRRARRARARELLARVGMAERMRHVPAQLSGGEQQRVTIARAVANEPQVLLLDEPTGDLDSANSVAVMKLLVDLNRDEGRTLIMVTHDVALKPFADRVVFMRDGKVFRVEENAPETVAESFEDMMREFRKSWEVDDEGKGSIRAVRRGDSDDEAAGGEGERAGLLAGAQEPGEPEPAHQEFASHMALRRTRIRKPTDYVTHPKNVFFESKS